MQHAIIAAWRNTAPKRLVKQFDDQSFVIVVRLCRTLLLVVDSHTSKYSDSAGEQQAGTAKPSHLATPCEDGLFSTVAVLTKFVLRRMASRVCVPWQDAAPLKEIA